MKLAYATTFDAKDVLNWSGTPFYMSHAFQQEDVQIDYIGNLSRKLPPFFKLKQTFKKTFCNQRESPRFNVVAAKYYSLQAARQVKKCSVDAILAPQLNPICYLESQKPILLWTDGLYASLLGFYPGFSSHSASSIEQGNAITRECLSRCSLTIFSSDWAANSAREIYGVPKEKVKVVPFGANLQSAPTQNDIQHMLKLRPRDRVKLLFLGKHWHRKGGDIVFNVAKALHQAGQPVELNFVGCHPPKDITVHDYIKCHGFISKRTPDGLKKITDLLSQSHFLFLPSRAEAYGIVFCEASAFGLPSLTSYVGGIPTAVKDNINGMTFGLSSPPHVYCNYIMDLMQNYSRYEELALSSFNEYQTRLNWQSATQTVKKLIQEIR